MKNKQFSRCYFLLFSIHNIIFNFYLERNLKKSSSLVNLLCRLKVPIPPFFAFTPYTSIVFNYKEAVITFTAIDNWNEKEFGIETQTNTRKNNYDVCIMEPKDFKVFIFFLSLLNILRINARVNYLEAVYTFNL